MNLSNATLYINEHFSISKALDAYYVYLLIPLSLISFFFNCFSFYVISKDTFIGNKFYSYTKLYILNGIILSLISTTAFISLTHTILDFTNSSSALIYSRYIFYPIQSMFFLYGSLVEICITMERSLYFLPRSFRKMNNIGFNKFCLGLFLISGLVNLPLYFFYEIKSLDQDQYILDESRFLNTLLGLVLYYTRVGLVYILPCIFKLLMISLIFLLIRKHILKLKLEDKILAKRISPSTGVPIYDYTTVANINKSKYISKTDCNKIYIALLVSSFSLIENGLFISAHIIYFTSRFYLYNALYFGALTSITLKYVFNFIIMLKFNFSFRLEIKTMFKS